ncbi:putative RNA-binding protein with PIN domain [Halopolyspora algeriensis]|uniref:Putative RNA-binding protein with PIN domain n=1 Tax=Halopolyspora algeriensis TaxID=1500506 RepID=A0A368VR22_9ACTN|nr:NYN domain-containing protein [Halopolyspora algeriensis]RCW44054.1 putative RNA-binding protein with PIN domain [Halopolyspora algeriensis]TQM53447.1 putative RNA-binding protein with PIN domain [Halopolyspora algeriensis]
MGDDDRAPLPDESVVGRTQQTGDGGSRVDWDTLPGPVTGRLAELSAAALGTMRSSDVPGQLRPVMRFAVAKRAKLGAATLIAALRDSTVFRTAVVDWCRQHRPEALDLGHEDPVVVAVAALLEDSAVAAHYVELVGCRAERGQLRSERDSAVARADKLAGEVEQLRRELAEAKSAAERAGEADNSDAERFRKRLREQGVRLKEAKQEAESARAELERVREESAAAISEATVQRDREQAKAQEERARAERAATETEVARQSAREARQGDENRLALLLETMEGALGGLRRELGATGGGPRPAEAVTGVRTPSGTPHHVADRAALDRLLALPAVHLIVDGYNVTKTGYPELPLADQRDRLAHQLAALAAQTGAEVTLVFDGADVVSVPAAGPRGVRVMFSSPGVQADDVIRDLVEKEPQGRQLVVATSDREVVTSVRHRGAYAVASSVLLARISRT